MRDRCSENVYHLFCAIPTTLVSRKAHTRAPPVDRLQAAAAWGQRPAVLPSAQCRLQPAAVPEADARGPARQHRGDAALSTHRRARAGAGGRLPEVRLLLFSCYSLALLKPWIKHWILLCAWIREAMFSTRHILMLFACFCYSLNLLNVKKYKSGRLEFSAPLPQVKILPGE